MTESGTTDDDLAAKVGSDRTTISRIRRGKRRPSMALAEAISQASGFAVRLDDFSILPQLAASEAA